MQAKFKLLKLRKACCQNRVMNESYTKLRNQVVAVKSPALQVQTHKGPQSALLFPVALDINQDDCTCCNPFGGHGFQQALSKPGGSRFCNLTNHLERKLVKRDETTNGKAINCQIWAPEKFRQCLFL